MKSLVCFILFCFFVSGMSAPAVLAHTYTLYDPATGLDIRIDGNIDHYDASVHFHGTLQSDITGDLQCDIVLQGDSVSGHCTNDLMGTFEIQQAPESISSVVKEGVKHAAMSEQKPLLGFGLPMQECSTFFWVSLDRKSEESDLYKFLPLLRRPRWG